MKRIQPLLLVLAWAGVIFILSGLNDDHFGIFGGKVIRKIGHLVEYFVLAYVVYRASMRFFNIGDMGASLAAGFLPLLFAFSDEFHQSFISSRICDIRDVGIDMVGVLCFFIFLEIKDHFTAATTLSNSSS